MHCGQVQPSLARNIPLARHAILPNEALRTSAWEAKPSLLWYPQAAQAQYESSIISTCGFILNLGCLCDEKLR